MGSSISLRGDFDGERLRRLARQTKDAAQARRLLALAEIYDAVLVRMRRGWAMSRSRSCGTGSCVSTHAVLMV